MKDVVGDEAVQQHGRVGIPEEGVATSLDLVAMATLLPALKEYNSIKALKWRKCWWF